ncbi:MAG TPA: DinB family protein [Vicinamibacterales bacterium]|nr:DinB family protein [Vicinamibacterales bacterium]
MPPTDTVNATQTSGLLEQLEAIRRRTEALLARVPDDGAFNRQPDGGGWSVGQCLDHLNQMNRLYFGAIRGALSRAERSRAPVTAPLSSSWFGNWFVASMEPGTRKFRAPRKAVPRSSAARAEVTAEFLRGLDEIEAALKDAAAIDLNRPTFASPFFRLSRVRAGTGFRVLLAHMRRHLQQAEHVVNRRQVPGRPTAEAQRPHRLLALLSARR